MFRKGLGHSIPPGEEAVHDGIGMDGFSADRCPLPPALDLIRRLVCRLEVGATRGFHDVVADRFTAELAAFEPRADGDFCDALFASAHGVDGKVTIVPGTPVMRSTARKAASQGPSAVAES